MFILEKQLESFYSSLSYNRISSDAISVYNFILYIAMKANSVERLSIANITIMSTCNIPIKRLQNARNELITKNYIKYIKGRNQNETPKYTIPILYETDDTKIRQADDQPEGQPKGQALDQPNDQADGHIITILYLLFNYINKGENANFFKDISESQRIGIQNYLKKLDVFVPNYEALKYFNDTKTLEISIQYYVVKELYFSSYRVILSQLTKEEFMLKFLKTKKYVDLKDESIKKFINYFIKTLKQKIDRGFEISENSK